MNSEIGGSGSRITIIDKLCEYTDQLYAHIKQTREIRNGLASIIKGACDTCDHTIILQTSKKVKGPCGYSRWECNVAAVWGQMSAGQGHRQLEESMSVLGAPVMSKASFISTEWGIGEQWKAELKQSMADSGQDEKWLAEERGGIPQINVIVDVGGQSDPISSKNYNREGDRKATTHCSENQVLPSMQNRNASEGSCLL